MVVPTETPDRPTASSRVNAPTESFWELSVGCLLLSVATLAGLLFVRRPWPNRLDAIGFSVLPADPSARWAADLARLGSLTILLAGVGALCVVAAISRNWIRAVSCLVAPVAAVLIVETVAKPLIGRQLKGALSYPSGTVTAVAALVAAAFLVTPRFAKPFAAVAGGMVVAAVCAAVVVLRWHFPTDALGGACVGAGAVLAVDGFLLWIHDRPPVRRALAALQARIALSGGDRPKETTGPAEAPEDRPLRDLVHSSN